MGIQIVGEPEALKSLGLSSSEFSNQLKKNLNQLSVSTEEFQSIQTFVIPDLRDSTAPSTPVEFETQPSARTISNLELIKKSIESSFESQGRGINRQELDQLRSEIEKPAKANVNDVPFTQPETTVQQPSEPTRSDVATASPGDIPSPESEKETESNSHNKALPVKKNLLPPEKCFLAKLNLDDKEIKPVVEAIDKRFPEQGQTVLLFTRSESNDQLSSVVARTAVALQKKTKSRILIIDCDKQHSALFQQQQPQNSAGLAGLNNPSFTWENIVARTSFQDIDIATLGPNHAISDSKISQLIKTTVGTIQDKYDFVLVNAGNAHHNIAETWSKHVNGTFLLVSLESSNQEIAKSAVTQLNQYGARLIGCIVSEDTN